MKIIKQKKEVNTIKKEVRRIRNKSSKKKYKEDLKYLLCIGISEEEK